MSATVHTPESLRFSRSDSKNPAATCKGITGNGRHCRRALAVGGEGIRRGGNGDGPEYYCHQHKDQARLGQVESGTRKADIIRERSSIETLVQRLGIRSMTEKKTKGKGRRDGRIEEKDFAAGGESQTELTGRRKENTAQKRKRKQPGFWDYFCCGGAAAEGDDYVEIVRHRRRVDAQARPSVQEFGKTASRPAPLRNASSNTATNHLLALLPPHLSPQTTSTLLAELVKPISPADEEGYIYIYWLTKTEPEEGTARDLFAPPGKQSNRRVSELLKSEGIRPGTITLKIGRANNVTRRMKEWERQCGFKLNLVRWYPYVVKDGSSPPASLYRGSAVHKVPYVKRVERLIHLELAGQQVRRQCRTCGKEHREWFEVQATRDGVRGVDSVVRRWVKWAEERTG